MKMLPALRAQITFHRAQSGKPETPIVLSRYRANIVFPFGGADRYGAFFLDERVVARGDSFEADLSFWAEEAQTRVLLEARVGMTFSIYERKEVGTGVIIRVYREGAGA